VHSTARVGAPTPIRTFRDAKLERFLDREGVIAIEYILVKL
jgi:hypothetical protein